ncbi:Histidyl-tRNA synthetase [Triticum urartu]|uniref:histidine--tRNA ligase n=1 Tax=Triticum urartu TaxID=4572 RepID=M8AR60_TRIUA|nr:Histidyl-tRNA synthetase [Triticum urartu]
MRLRTWLFDHFREVSRLMAFEEVDFPVLESEALFVRKAGEEITEQLYSFEDKGGRRVVLRPEITPSLARLVIRRGTSAPLPLKWFTIGQCWRYERMTRGRRREHYQWNMDVFGVPGVRAEAELLQAIVLLFERLGVVSSDVGIRLSSRKVLQVVLDMYSVPQHLFTPVCVIVDKLGKMSREEIEKELISTGLPSEAVQGIIDVLSLKSLPELEEVLGSGGAEAVADLKKLFSFAEQYGYADWLCFDASVVRGLAYYTGIVFEAFDRQGELRAICGGGSPLSIGRALEKEFKIPPHLLRVTNQDPEDFFVFFTMPAHKDLAMRQGSLSVDGVPFLLEPWREDAHAVRLKWMLHVRVVIEKLPMNLWTLEGAGEAIGDKKVTQKVIEMQLQGDAADAEPPLFAPLPQTVIGWQPVRDKTPLKTRVVPKPTRQSLRQASNPSPVPVSERATLRQVHGLGILGPKEKMTAQAAEALIHRFDEPLTDSDIAAIAKLTCLDPRALKAIAGVNDHLSPSTTTSMVLE